MKKRIAFGLAIAAAVAAVFILVYMPGCGIVDLWLFIQLGCEAAGGGGSGAA